MKIFRTILITTVILFILGMAGYSILDKPYQEIAVGTDTVLTAGLSTYTLSGSGISSTATSVGLTKLTIPQNDYAIQDSDLSATFYITIEPGNTSRQEFASCTTVGTNTGSTVTLSGCTRGLSPISPYTASSTLQFSHAGGSKMIFSNSPQLYNDAAFKGNDETITGTWLIGAPTADTQIATKKYADDLAIAGAPDASLTVKGLLEVATQTGMASTSVAGSGDTTAWLGLSAAYSTSTPSGDSYSGLFLPVAENDGYLSQLWTRLTDAYTWTGAHIFSSTVNISGLFTATATSTMATTTTTAFTTLATSANPLTLNTVDYDIESSDGSSGERLTTDGSGGLTWETPQPANYSNVLTTDTTVANGYATSTLLTIPAGIMTASSTIAYNLNLYCINNDAPSLDCNFYIRTSDGVNIASLTHTHTGNEYGAITGNVTGTTINNNSTSAQITTIGGVLSEGADPSYSVNLFSEGTNTIDTSAETTFMIVSYSSGANVTANIRNASIVITP